MGGRKGGVIVKSLEREVAVAANTGTEYAVREASPQRDEVANKEERAAEKPKASEEIVIEEISIDGMCGVY
jgi:mycofactocin precursor